MARTVSGLRQFASRTVQIVTLARSGLLLAWKNAPARPLSRQLLRRLQLRGRVHSVLSRAHRQGAGRRRLSAAGAQGRAAAFFGGLLRRRRERVRRLPLLAGPAPDLVVRPPRVRVPAGGRRGSLPRRRDRAQVLRSDGEELHQVPGRHGRRPSSASTRRRWPSSSSGPRSSTAPCSPTRKMAVELKEPALRLMTFIENNRQPEPADRFIARPRQPPAGRDRRRSVRRGAVEAAAGAAPAQHRGHPEKAKLEGNVAFFDLADHETARSTSSSPITCSPRRATPSA